MTDRVAHAISETITTLRSAGLKLESWVILSQSNRVVLELRPCGWIAKVVHREASERLNREVALSQHIAACAGPCARPATPSGPFLARTVAVSLWQPIASTGLLSESDIGRAYAELRPCLDSFTEPLPDFHVAIRDANELLQAEDLPGMTAQDNAFVRAVFDHALSELAAFHWTTRVLHGDPHSGNITLTPQGARWFDLESACNGPLEWDLTALPSGALAVDHDPALLAVLLTLRRACVVTWCAAKAVPSPVEREAIAHHLAQLSSRASGALAGPGW